MTLTSVASDIKDLAGGVVSGGGGLALGYLAQYAFTLAVAARFDAGTAGDVYTLASAAFFLALVARTGFDRLAIKWVAIADSEQGRGEAGRVAFSYLGRTLAQAVALSLLLLIVLGIWSPGGFGLAHPAAVPLLLLIPGGAGVFVLAGALRGLGRVASAALVQNAIPFGTAALLLWTGQVTGLMSGLEWGVLGLTLGAFLSMTVGVWHLFRLARDGAAVGDAASAPDAGASADHTRLFAGRFYFTGMALLAFFSSGAVGLDILILRAVVDSQVVGIYGLASRSVFVLAIGITAINSILGPMVAARWQAGRRAEAQALIRRASTWSLSVAMVAGAVLLALTPRAVGWFGPEYAAATGVVYVLAFGQLVNAATGPVSMVQQMIGEERRATIQFGTVLALMIPLYLVGGLLHGALGAAVVTAVGRSVQWLWMSASLVTRYRFRPDALGSMMRAGVPVYLLSIWFSILFSSSLLAIVCSAGIALLLVGTVVVDGDDRKLIVGALGRG